MRFSFHVSLQPAVIQKGLELLPLLPRMFSLCLSFFLNRKFILRTISSKCYMFFMLGLHLFNKLVIEINLYIYCPTIHKCMFITYKSPKVNISYKQEHEFRETFSYTDSPHNLSICPKTKALSTPWISITMQLILFITAFLYHYSDDLPPTENPKQWKMLYWKWNLPVFRQMLCLIH